MFKVGDYVEVIRGYNCEELPVGSKGRITKIYTPGNLCARVNNLWNFPIDKETVYLKKLNRDLENI